MFNALQPGVFALSGWDLTGMLTLDAAQVADLHRRRRHALDQPRRPRPHGRNGEATQSEGGMPAGRSLYGTLPAQLAGPAVVRQSPAPRSSPSAASTAIATATQVDIPDVSHGRCS